jgi:LacI family transcriptional regulator
MLTPRFSRSTMVLWQRGAAMVRRLHFILDGAAVQVRHQQRVGVAIDATMGFGRQIMRGIMQYANLSRRWLLLEEFRSIDTDFSTWPRCDGAIVAFGDPRKVHQLKKSCRHLVCCSGAADPAAVDIVRVESHAIGALAANHLLDCRLVHFGYYGSHGLRYSQDRIAGFREALARRQLTCAESPVTYAFKGRVGRGPQSHWPKLIAWVKSLPKPVGILAVDDMAAHDLAAACLESNIPIPEQVALVGVNNDDLLCESAWPPLSSVNADYQRAGFFAAQLLDELMSSKKPLASKKLIELPPAGVVVRASTDSLAVDDPMLASAIRFIREHACDPCSVSDILREVPVGRRWLERQFTLKLGRTPYDEILHARMETARRLLLRPEIKMLEVAERCGFSSIQSFSRAFHQHTTETPGRFRRVRTVGGLAATPK